MRLHARAYRGHWVLPAGLLGGCCVSLGALAYASMPTDGRVGSLAALRSVRTTPGAELYGLAFCFVGVALLTASWLVLGIAVRAGCVDVTCLRRVAIAWVVPLLIAPPLFSGDGWSYAADAALVGRGVSPYVVTPSALHGPIVQGVCECWLHTAAPYGPLPLIWGGAFALVTTSPWALMSSYRLLAIGGLAMLLWAAPRLAVMSRVRPVTVTWLIASPYVLVVGVGGTHLDLVMVGLVAVALALTPARGWLFGATLIGFAAAVKAPAAVAGIGVALLSLGSSSFAARTWHAVRIALLVGAVVVAVGLVADWGLGWLNAMRSALVLHTPLSITYDTRRVLAWLSVTPDAAFVDAVAAGVLLVILAGLLALTPVHKPHAALLAVSLGTLATTILSPVTNTWYYLWCVPLLAAARLPIPARAALITFVAALGVLAPLDPALHIPETGPIVICAAITSVTLGALIGWRGRASRFVMLDKAHLTSRP